MIAATNGIKSEVVSVLDYMPSESLSWIKRTKKRRGIKDGKAQSLVIKQAFGFR